ncbi:MAG: dephospho-CoA kinase [Deltaproteobacteria bacterium]|nr:dephospho-CoA kinase [Deltaproteobacteria bacterium]MCW8892788.1 dephospho-CoA kinase [Deltaproteobacteria bacterium]
MILGVTGNIASGKSTVAKEFELRGAVVVDADQLAREVVAPESATLGALAETFGDQILKADGRLDRERLGEIIFTDAEARQHLNAIVHPAIAELAVERLQELRQRADIPLIVYEAPLLFEAGAEGRVDKILVVKIAAEEQLKRLMARNGFDEATAQARMAAQMDQQEKIKRADFIVDNSGSLEETCLQIDALWQQLVEE